MNIYLFEYFVLIAIFFLLTSKNTKICANKKNLLSLFRLKTFSNDDLENNLNYEMSKINLNLNKI